MHEGNTMKLAANLLKISLLLALLPASASAALIVSDWIATPTSVSFKITGQIDGEATIGVNQKDRLFIGPNGLPAQEEKPSTFIASVTSLGGSPTALSTNLVGEAGEAGAYMFNDNESNGFTIEIARANTSNWQAGDILNYSVSFSNSSLYDLTSWDPSGAIVSAGSGVPSNIPEAQYQVGSFASVPDTGSTAALLGAGVAALAFARRRLG
tara:strand:- start:71 stop:703 length:633 start_codon:yes stop_codon:yes gene_type:complete